MLVRLPGNGLSRRDSGDFRISHVLEGQLAVSHISVVYAHADLTLSLAVRRRGGAKGFELRSTEKKENEEGTYLGEFRYLFVIIH